VKFRGTAIEALDGPSRREAALKIQMIFQDPMASLNPRMRVVDIVGEAPVVHGIVPRSERQAYVASMLARVGLDPSYRNRYPHQFSGGQRARIGIARALAVEPDFLVCDESVAALDVSIQAQVLNLFHAAAANLKLTYLFISHDLGVVEHLSDRSPSCTWAASSRSRRHPSCSATPTILTRRRCSPTCRGSKRERAVSVRSREKSRLRSGRPPAAISIALPIRHDALPNRPTAPEDNRARSPLRLSPQ